MQAPFSPESLTPLDLNQGHFAAVEAVRAVAPDLRRHFGRAALEVGPLEERAWVKHRAARAEEAIRERLEHHFGGGIGCSGEETGTDRRGDVYWTIDPIDDKANFVNGNALCTTMLALVDHNQPVVGAMYDFNRDTIYSAIAGQGAKKNFYEPLRVSDRPFEQSYVELYANQDAAYGSRVRPITDKATMLSNAPAGDSFISIARGSAEGLVYLDNPDGAVYDTAPGQFAGARSRWSRAQHRFGYFRCAGF